jgi:hypothetical protein
MRHMLEFGGDPSLVDRVGNSAVHHLLTGKGDLLSRLIIEYGIATESIGCLHTLNAFGLTPMRVAAMLKKKSVGHTHMHFALDAAQREWELRIRPCLLRVLTLTLPVTDIARICCEYIDGSGRAWPVEVKEEEDVETKSSNS